MNQILPWDYESVPQHRALLTHYCINCPIFIVGIPEFQVVLVDNRYEARELGRNPGNTRKKWFKRKLRKILAMKAMLNI